MKKNLAYALILSGIGLLISAFPVTAEDPTISSPSITSLSPDKLEEAQGHYAKARALLIAAVHEFDLGLKIADTSSIISPKAWRDTVIDKADDLEKITEPKAKEATSGVKYQGNSNILKGK